MIQDRGGPFWVAGTPDSSGKLPTRSSATQVQQVHLISQTPSSKGEDLLQRPKMLDLFSGTGSVGRVFQDRGYEVTSVDIEEHFKPTIVADVLNWDYQSIFKPGHF